MTQNIGDSGENAASEETKNLIVYVVAKNDEVEFFTKLEQKVTIGYEVGDLLVPHETVSARHCTIFNNRNVYSIIDHSTQSGTFINNKKLDAGKIYLLDSSDKIKVGDLTVSFEMREQEPEQNPEPVIPTAENLLTEEDRTRELSSTVIAKFESKELEEETSEFKIDKVEEDVGFSSTEIRKINDQSEEHETIIAKKMPFIPKPKGEVAPSTVVEPVETKIKKKSKVKTKKLTSSSALTRVIANLNDFLMTYLVVNLLEAFEESKELMSQIVSDSSHIFLELVSSPVQKLAKALPELEQYHEIFFTCYYYLVFFVLFKMITALVFSITFGQFITGIRIEGNFAWKRLIAPFRIFFGTLFFPVLIFDLPTVFSKRSLKEVITKTQFVTTGGLVGALFMIISTLLLLTLIILSPLVKGFEVLPSVDVIVKTQETQNISMLGPEYIESLNLSFESSSDAVAFIPSANLRLSDRKKFIDIGLIGMDKENGAYFKMRKLKTFSFLDIFKSFSALNPAISFFYPEIHKLVKNIANGNKNFRLNIQNKEALLKEISKLLKDSYSLSFETFPSFVMSNGIFLSGYRDFREKISSLYDLEPESLEVKTIGNRVGIEGIHGKGKLRYFTFIPIGTINGSFYRIDGKWNSIKSKRLRSSLSFGKLEGARSESYVSEFINLSQKGIIKDRFDINQSLYENYFELSKWSLESDQKNIVELLKKSLTQMINILNLDNKSNQKLTQNLSELLQALRDENFEFFTIQETEII